jgi:reactive chlorine resistance protein C
MSLSKLDSRIARVDQAGLGVLRYGLVFLLVVIGATKFTAWEAANIEPLVSNSPVLFWLPRVLGLQGASNLIGAIEIATGLAIAARRFAPTLSAIGSVAAVGTFVTTLSFLFTTPGALSPMHPASAFLMKDVVLLGASLATAAEAARAARARRSPAMVAARPQAA